MNLRTRVSAVALLFLCVAALLSTSGCAGAPVTVMVNNAGSAPAINGLNPTTGAVGALVTISGMNFGTAQGSNTVTFSGITAMPTSWSGTSIVVTVPTGAATGNVVVTVGGVASNGVLFTVTTSTVALPIKASANKRYFVDQNNTPWLMVGDSAHNGICNLSQSNWNAYFADRKANGFNTVDLLALDGASSCGHTTGAAFDGTLPFTTGTTPATYDVSTPNSAFWSEVDTFINSAASNGLVVAIDPAAWGNGFAIMLQNNGATKDFSYGVFLGNRYKNFTNIIWHLGQDFDGSSFPSSANVNLVAQVMAGIASVDSNHIQMCQLNFNASYSSQALTYGIASYNNNLGADFVYTYFEVYDEMLKAYNDSTIHPTFLGETNYETGNNTRALSSPANAFITRQEMWYAMTSGATGHIFGNEHINHFDSSYTSNLNTTATAQVKYLPALLAQYSWWTFAPDQTHALVTAGYGSYNGGNGNMYNATYAPTTWNQASSYSITYTPVATTLTVALGMFTKPVTAEWYDPTTGTATVISGSPFANSGSQTFATPSAAHADGTHDWVLVFHP